MTASYTHIRLGDVEDSAPKFGFSETQEARFARSDLELGDIGLSFHRVKPGKRQGFAHHHDAPEAEEVYVVISGSGRMKIDDDVIDLAPLDAIRVAPAAMRQFEGGPDGLEVVAFGRHFERDGDIHPGWWSD